MSKLINLEQLTLKDVIETFTTYNLRHVDFPHNFLAQTGADIPEIDGLTLDDKKIIYINTDTSLEYRRAVLIHEFLHTKHYRQGDLPRSKTESVVEKETKLTYYDLYGVKT